MSAAFTSLEALVAYNGARLRAFMERPLVGMIQGKELDDPAKLRVFLACVRRFSMNFQSLMFIRQALCTDPRFYPTFLRHLSEEFGHDALLSGSDMPEPIQDTLFEAILGWFNYQMIVLDNAERAALMHLVLEAGGDRLHALTAARLREKVDSGYFDAHAELDAGHADMALQVLQELPAATYQRLGLIVGLGWDMLEAITERARQLVLECK